MEFGGDPDLDAAPFDRNRARAGGLAGSPVAPFRVRAKINSDFLLDKEPGEFR
jgi:hypothetical protein